MPGQFFRNAIVVSLACWTFAATAAEPAATVVRSPAQLQAVLSSSQPSPLDALTPYGKRRFVDSLRWDAKGQATFDTTILVRQLDAQQLAAVLAFVGEQARLPKLAQELVGQPLRMEAPTADAVARLRAIERIAARLGSQAGGDASQLSRRYMELFGRHLNEYKLADLPPADLPLYFDAAALATRGPYGPQGESVYYWKYPVRHLLMVYTALKDRGIDTRRTLDATVLRSLLDAQEFNVARQFMSDKPHLRELVIPSSQVPVGAGANGRGDMRLAHAGL